MANKYDYLTEYRQFFEKFADTVEPNDQLPVKLGSYKFFNTEVVGGITDWCLQYLNRKSCPSSLIAPLIKTTIDEIRQACKKHPVACGFNPNDNVYEPLKLMQTVMSKMNEVCLRYLDNSQLDTLPAPSSPLPKISVFASRNTRRRMEDRHVIIQDLNTMFNIEDSAPSSYYAIFDGHAGPDAAAYSAAHLHQFIAESQYYPTDPERALKEAFLKTDEFFLEKSRVENFRSGTTAVCALFRPKQQKLYVAWVGDSQALLVNSGKVLQIVKPHKPSRNDEKDRIEANGGCVMFWGMWRVNGQLAVSRAIGDLKLKPYVIADPDVAVVPLDGNEEFLIMACDGLWDFVSEDDAALEVYSRVKQQPDNTEDVAKHLVSLAQRQGSKDNISVIVVFIKDPQDIASSDVLSGCWAQQGATADQQNDMDMDNTNLNLHEQDNLFADMFHKPSTQPINGKDEDNLFTKGEHPFKQEENLFSQDPTLFPQPNLKPDNLFSQDSNLFNDDTNLFSTDTNLYPQTNLKSDNPFAQDTNLFSQDSNHFQTNLNADNFNLFDHISTNGKQHTPEFDEDDDMGPESNVDAVDDILMSPTLAKAREIAEGINNNDDKEDLGYGKEERESATPPADSVLDSSGIADNVADSGDDSEDEWNFYRVDPNKETIQAAQPEISETQEIVSEDQSEEPDMSQLNPNAAEFVPVSPTRNMASPTYNRDLLDDKLIAQSPRRALPMDIDVPNATEFENEVKSRPSEVYEEEIKTEAQNGHQMSTQELMANFLNGKDINEIDFHPQNYVKSVEHKDDLNISGVMETVASPIEPEVESEKTPDQTDFVPIVPKESDPMNMSFYEDKDEPNEFSQNPFDLNQVQRIPDEEFVDDEVEVEEKEVTIEKEVEISSENLIEPVEVEVTKSPVESLEVCPPVLETVSPGPMSPKSPMPELTGLVSPDVTASVKDEIVVEDSKSPAFSQHSTASPIDNIKSPEIQHEALVHHEPEVDPIPEPITEPTPEPEIEPTPEPEPTSEPTNLMETENVHETPEIHDLEMETQELKTDSENITNEFNEQVMSLENVVKEVERDTANFIENKMSMEISDTLQHIEENITEKANELITNFENNMNETREMVQEIKNDIITKENDIESENEDQLSNIEEVHSEIKAIKCTFEFSEDVQPKDEMKFIEEGISHMVEDARHEAELIAKSPEYYPEDNQAVNLIEPEVEFEPQPSVDLLAPMEPLESNPTPVSENVEITRQLITPEFAVPTLTSPLEEKKEIETVTPPATPVVVQEEVKAKSPEPQQIVEAVEKLTEEFSSVLKVEEPPKVENEKIEKEITETEKVEPVAVAPVKTEVTSKSPKPKTTATTTTAAKKPATKTSPTSPTKPLASKTSTTAATKKTTTTTTSTAASKPRVPSATAPKTTLAPKPAPISKTSPRKPLEKKTLTNGEVKSAKPLANGDAKPGEKKPLTNGVAKAPLRRPISATTAKTATDKAASAKPAVPKTTTAPRPASGPAKTAPRVSAASATAKPKSATTTTARTTLSGTTTTKTTTSTKPAVSSTLKSTTTAAPKPRTTPTTTAAPKPRTTLTSRAKAPDTEKQQKETVNKQISASRTPTTTRTTTTTSKTTTLKSKVEPKVPSARTTSKTTTTTLKSTTGSKKPEVTNSTTITKTKGVTTKITPKQNGVVNVIQEITTTVSTNIDEPKLLKDNSPVDTPQQNNQVVDNALLLENNTITAE